MGAEPIFQSPAIKFRQRHVGHLQFRRRCRLPRKASTNTFRTGGTAARSIVSPKAPTITGVQNSSKSTARFDHVAAATGRWSGHWDRQSSTHAGQLSAARRSMPNRSRTRQILQPQQRWQQMQRRGQPAAGRHVASSAVGTKKMQRAVGSQQIVQSRAAAEIGQIRATTEANMLAMIDQRAAGGIAKRSWPGRRVAVALRTM